MISEFRNSSMCNWFAEESATEPSRAASAGSLIFGIGSHVNLGSAELSALQSITPDEMKSRSRPGP